MKNWVQYYTDLLQHAIPRLKSLETCEAFRSEICEMMNKIDGSTQERIRVICAICSEKENI